MTMTVSDNRARVIHAGNGSATTFSFSFEIFDEADLRVFTVDEDGNESELDLDAAGGFSVTLNGAAPSAGYVTYPIDVNGTVLTTSEQLVIMREIDYEQQTDITNASSFRASVIENAFDRIVMLAQQLKDRLDRSLTAAVSTPTNADYTLPTPKAGYAIGWNGDADGLVNIDLSTGIGVIEQTDSQFHVVDTFLGDGSTRSFTLSAAPGHKNAVEVFIDGVYQQKSSFSISGTTITFGSVAADAPPSGNLGLDNIEVIYRQYTQSVMNTPAATSVGTTQLANNAVTYLKLDSTVRVRIEEEDAPLTYTAANTDYIFSHTLAGTIKPKVMMLKLKCTDAGGDQGYSQNDEIIIAPSVSREGTGHYGFIVTAISTSGFRIKVASGGIAILHKTSMTLNAITAGKWSMTPVVLG